MDNVMKLTDKTKFENVNPDIDYNDFGSSIQAKSKIKLIKNTKGVNFEISVVSGEEHLIEGLRKIAIENYKKLEEELVIETEKEKGGVK